MSTLAKVNLFQDLDALALYPFKRLFIQRKNDHYQLATSQFASRLRLIYRAGAEARLRRRNEARRRLVSALLRLDGSSQSAPSLSGITVARSSFPSAQPNEQIILVEEATNEVGQNDDERVAGQGGQPRGRERVISHGIIQTVTESEIKIKLFKPIVLREEANEPKGAAAEESKPTTGPEFGPSPCAAGSSSEDGADSDRERQDKDGDDDSDGDGENEIKPFKADDGDGDADADSDKAKLDDGAKRVAVTRVVDFRIKYHIATPSSNDVDENSLLVWDALTRFEQLKCDSAIHKNLLGFYDERSDLLHEKARVVPFDGELAKLRGQQRLAVEQAIKRRVSLIEGPAGSGKSLVAAYIAANMSRLKRSKVLVCSPLQANVDRLAELIDQVDGVQVIKLPDGPVKLSLYEVLGQAQQKPQQQPQPQQQQQQSQRAPGREVGGASSRLEALGETQASRCQLDKLVDDEIYLQAWNRSKETLRNHQDSLHAHAYRMVTTCSQHRRREMEAKLLARCDVVCCTNKQAGSYLLNGFEFNMLILDDVQVTSEVDCLIPMMMVKGIKQLVLLSESRKRIRLARTLRRAPRANGHAQQGGPSASQSTNHIDQIVPAAAPVAPPPPQQQQQQNGTRPDRRGSLRRRQNQIRDRKARGQSLPQAANGQLGTLTRAASSGQQLAAGGSSFEPGLEPGGLFERLLAIGLPAVDLRVQFRLHETLANFTNNHFYLGRLKNDPETNERLTKEIDENLLLKGNAANADADDANASDAEKPFEWLPNRKYLTAMYNVAQADTSQGRGAAPFSASSSPSASGGRQQATRGAQVSAAELSQQMIEKLDQLISKLVFHENIQESRIGIMLNRRPRASEAGGGAGWMKQIPRNIKTGSVADFVGQERDFVILVALPAVGQQDETGASQDEEAGEPVDCAQMCICSEIKCDFRRDDAALNCALTRARLALFVVAANLEWDEQMASSEADGGRDSRLPAPPPPQTQTEQQAPCRGWLDLVQYYRACNLLTS